MATFTVQLSKFCYGDIGQSLILRKGYRDVITPEIAPGLWAG
jgi:hypothetical protein